MGKLNVGLVMICIISLKHGPDTYAKLKSRIDVMFID